MAFLIADESVGGSNQKWLGSAHATNEAQTVTLKVDAFADFGKTIPSGVPLKQAENGLYEPVTAAEDTLAGFLLTDQNAKGDHQVAPMIWHGRIRPAFLPEKAFDVTTLTEASASFVFATKEEVEA